MPGKIAVFGYGPVGHATVERLTQKGQSIVVLQRTAPTTLPAGAEFRSCDVLDAKQVIAAAGGVEQIVVSVGLPYKGSVWRRQWPRVMTHLVAVGEASGARIVFVDNLYMYGPQREPLREDMPLTQFGAKPRARAEATRIWMKACEAGRAKIAALRAPDFYGPNVGLSMLGETSIGALARGKAASLIVPPDMPHDYAYVPDIARAVETLLDAPDDAYGQAWHVPCAPIRTTRELLELAASALDRKLKLNVFPGPIVRLLGLFVPFLREFPEMRFQWDRPYHVDSSKFAGRFWNDPTPFEIGIPLAAWSFRAKAASPRIDSKH